MSNLNKILQEPTRSIIYMTFLPTRSGDPVGRPGRETRSGYFVGTPPRVRDIRVGGARDYQCIWFRTFGHSEFKFYYDLFYPARDRVASRRGRVRGRAAYKLTERVAKNIGEFKSACLLVYGLWLRLSEWPSSSL